MTLEQYLKDSSCKGHYCEHDFLDLSCEECKSKMLEEYNKRIKAEQLKEKTE